MVQTRDPKLKQTHEAPENGGRRIQGFLFFQVFAQYYIETEASGGKTRAGRPHRVPPQRWHVPF